MSGQRQIESPDPMLDREADEWVRRIKSGQATRGDAQALRQWCARSESHAAAFERARLAWADIGTAGRAFRQVHPQVAAANVTRPARRAFLGAGLAGAGAAAIAAAFPPLGLWTSVLDLGADYRTAVGEQRRVEWEQDVVVELDSHSSMNLSKGQNRLELLDGQAMITCAQGGRERVVAAGDGEIMMDSATVGVRRTAGSVTVTCLQGQVAIRHPLREIVLAAGQQAWYERGAVGTPVQADLEQAMGWREGVLVFRDMPLADAVAEINRYRPGRILVLDDALAARRVSGRFQIARLDQAIDRLRDAFGATVRTLPQGVVLLS